MALANTKGVIDIYKAPLSGMSSLIQTSSDQESIRVIVDSADVILSQQDAIDILKIDVE